MLIQKIIQKVLRNFKDYGVWTTIKKSIAYVISPIFYFQVYRLYKIDLTDANPIEKPLESDFTFRFLELDDQSAIEAIEQENEFLRGKLKEDIRKGNLCLVAFHDGNVAGFNAISFGEAHMTLVNYNRTFRSGEAWSVHIAVFENYRRMGLASNLRYQIFEELKQRGYKRLYGGALRSNTASLKLAERVGFKAFVDIVYIHFLFFERWKYTRVNHMN